MSPRLQRLLLFGLMAYFMLFGGTVYTELDPTLRIVHWTLTALALVAWLADLWRTGRVFPATPLDRPILALGAAWLLAALFSADARISLEYLWPVLAHYLAFYLLVDLMRRGRQRWIVEGLFIVATVVILLSALEMWAWYVGIPIWPGFVQGWPEVAGLTLPPLIHKPGLAFNVSTRLGNFLATVIPLVVAWAMTTRRRDLRAGGWLLGGGLVVILLLTRSRGAWMGLAAAAGVFLLAWLFREETRARVPARWRPLLDWRILLGATALAGIAGSAFIFGSALSVGQSGDLNRLDLWRSALAMTADHPLTGVGPYQYGAALRWYGDPDLSLSQSHLNTSHNLPLHTLAEGGIVVALAALWLGVAFARTWWRSWRGAYPGRLRRLEGALAALVAFGVHSMVDTFPLTQSLAPLMIIAAYVIAGDVTRVQAITQTEKVTPGRRSPVFALLALILVAQVALLPVHAGGLAYGRALTAIKVEDYRGALDAIRDAQAADPALGLYPLHEAHILGLLADENPGQYLDAAIAAHESGLAEVNPTWDRGWHNLAALYAQAGRYQDAMEAEVNAITWNPVPAGYHLKLGEYYEMLGQDDEAYAAFLEALRRNSDLASSGFWSDPAHPERTALLDELVLEFIEINPELLLHLLLASGNEDGATAIRHTVNPATASLTALVDAGLAATLHDGDPLPCYEAALARSGAQDWFAHLALAEWMLTSGQPTDDHEMDIAALDMTIEEAARYALFISQGEARRAWYVLAQLAERDGADDATINTLLVRAVPPISARIGFSVVVYGRASALYALPQAQMPVYGRLALEPAFVLAERLEAAGRNARPVYELLLAADPYLWEVGERLAE